MLRLASVLRLSWEKNWPEIRCACSGGLPRFVFAKCPSETWPGIPVFCYHQVEQQEFERDLIFLAENGYQTITADALLAHVKRESSAPKRSIVLTFDDGAVNLYRIVFPLLKKYSMLAVAFIATGLHKEMVEGKTQSANCQSLRPCNWSEILEMHESGYVDFQSHTHEHRDIPRWPEPVELMGADQESVNLMRRNNYSMEEDFRLAKETLERRLAKTIHHLAFPKFNGTDEALDIGKAIGYQGFWWGMLPHRRDNRPGDSPTHKVRISGEFLRRLPGEGRESLASILSARYTKNVYRWFGRGG